MGAAQIIIQLLKSVHLSDWSWAHNSASGKVQQAHVNLLPADLGFRVTFVFTEAGVTHTLAAERPFASDVSEVVLDGVTVPGGKLHVSHHLHLWPMRVEVEIDVDVPTPATMSTGRFSFTSQVK